ncbi:hypothetical protein AB205_0018940 [Aquarana catesbeiana]|uniref:Uncharacterized protein n=1 Tax=Aquarana catesbeiana TaxID=8400 RepID=A0A2G9SDW8_AQUCT|nr:hypothetical protein AB205_0018940 [Aquarana catesbeiana]
MCQYDPGHVTSMLQILEHYRLEETIQIAQKHNNHETLAYLLEKKGDIQAAFEVMLTVKSATFFSFTILQVFSY